jgi:hypothetical protein
MCGWAGSATGLGRGLPERDPYLLSVGAEREVVSARADEGPGVDPRPDECDRVELPAGVVGNVRPAPSWDDPWDVRCAEPVQDDLAVQPRSGQQRDPPRRADDDVGAAKARCRDVVGATGHRDAAHDAPARQRDGEEPVLRLSGDQRDERRARGPARPGRMSVRRGVSRDGWPGDRRVVVGGAAVVGGRRAAASGCDGTDDE